MDSVETPFYALLSQWPAESLFACTGQPPIRPSPASLCQQIQDAWEQQQSFNSGKAHFIAYNTELVFDNLTETQALDAVPPKRSGGR